ncbi:glycosyltransferase [Euzebyella marina]
MSYNNLSVYDYSLISNIKNYQVEYFCSSKYDYEEKNLNTNKIYHYSSKKGILKILSYLKSQFLLYRKIKLNQDKIRAIHFQWLKIPHLDFLLLKMISKKSEIILTAHNILPHGSGNKYRSIYKKIYHKVDRLIVHTNETKNDLVDLFEVPTNKIHVVPHGILDVLDQTENNRVLESAKMFNDLYGLNNKTVFSSLGSISSYKGIDIIINTWKKKELINRDDVVLLIAGSGKNEKLLELKGVNNAIVINRFLSSHEFLACVRMSDFILMPYTKISQSGILLTAIGEKKRVIVSNVGGLTEPFEIGEIGYVLDKVNSDSLGRAILRAIDEKDNYPDESVWTRLFKYYDWSNIGRKTELVYSV